MWSVLGLILLLAAVKGGDRTPESDSAGKKLNRTPRWLSLFTFKETTDGPTSVTLGLPATSGPFLSTSDTGLYRSSGDNGTYFKKLNEEIYFHCANGQKINKTLVCNRVNDCTDGSDESVCDPRAPKITVLPEHRVEVFCEDFQSSDDQSGTLELKCESVGHPPPAIRWKKYDGHVPSKCQQYSKRGHGILKCPNFQQSDQGAYSCIAENQVKSAESQPKSLAVCSNTIRCKGFRVVNEERFEHCLECYCSGKTTECQSLKSNSTRIKIPFTETRAEIFAKEDGEIVFVPTKTTVAPDFKTRQSALAVTYCSFSESDFSEASFLKSFGRSVIIPRYRRETGFLQKAPDLIVRGNGLSLMYTANLLSPGYNNVIDVSVKFWPGNWHHLNKTPANRKDLMKLLSKVENIFVRCEYEEGKILTLNESNSIIIESSTITQYSNAVSYVEKCKCPQGYDGLSCETCATGFEKEIRGDDFVCKRIGPIECETGYVGPNCSDCDTVKGYYKVGDKCPKSPCHPYGSLSKVPDAFGRCSCKERVTGNICDRCRSDSFYLHKARGCLECWCSGVTKQCTSSKLYRTVISSTPRGGYNSSDGRNFWLLPPDFSGNRLTSYGGHLNYTMTYKPVTPKQNTYLTVEIMSMDDITLSYTHWTVDNSVLNTEKSWSVPLIEIDWKKQDKTGVSRGEFLKVLSRVKAIYIESPYHLSSGKANLTSTRMSSASEDRDGGTDLAPEVEVCSCPPGYTGLSCESCTEGYYKKRKGSTIECIKCNCTYCDPDLGCTGCPKLFYRDNPEYQRIPICKPCPCNENGISCEKDDHGQIFCQCKPGYTGMHCEVPIPKKSKNLTISISPRTIEGQKVDTTAYVNCSVTAHEELTMTVKKIFKKGTQSNSKVLMAQGSEIFKTFDVRLEEGLQYIECLVHDAEGRLAGQVLAVVNLVIDQEPVTIKNCYSERIDVKESETREIICEATGVPTPWVNWYKKTNGSDSVKVDTVKGVHTIEYPSLEDNGTIYTCIAENSVGDKSNCTKILIVRKICEVVNITPKEVREIEGNNITIKCKSTAKSPVAWELTIRQRLISRIKVHKGHLFITNASVSDSGNYTCTAKGEKGKIEQTVTVTVLEKLIAPTASILEYDQTLKEGENFSMNCAVTGKPTPVVSWTKLNDSMPPNVIPFINTLSISNATLRNSGIYQCRAASTSGNATSSISIKVEKVKIPPTVHVSPDSIAVFVGDVANLTCVASGFPRPRITWLGLDVNFTITAPDPGPGLMAKEDIQFRVTERMNSTKVICLAENGAGKSLKSVEIKVLQPQGGVNETIEFAAIGSFVELVCDLPGNITWEKIGGQFVGDECKILNTLMIPTVQVQHNGTYECQDGSGSRRISLIVHGFVPKFSKSSRSYFVLPVHFKSYDECRIELSFNTANESGVLLEDEKGKLVIYLEKRKIHLSLISNTGNSLDAVMNTALDLEKWLTLLVTINKNYVDMTVYDENSSILERKTEKPADFKISMGLEKEVLLVGGPIPKSRHVRRLFLRPYSYFDGCISRLSVDRYEFNIVNEGLYSQNVSLCRRCTSGRMNPCEDKGTCLDAPTQRGFMCVCDRQRNKDGTCPASCKGRGCETQLDLCKLLKPCSSFLHNCIHQVSSLQCNCAYGYSGTTCERVQEYSFCAKGSGYVKLPSALLERYIGVAEVIRMSFLLHQPEGVLLWQGDSANHLSISVHQGVLQYVYLNQRTRLEIRSKTELELNKRYAIVLERMNSTVRLEIQLPHERLDYVNSTSEFYTNRVKGDIYLGNIPKGLAGVLHQNGLNGCLYYISFGDKAKINLPEEQIERADVTAPREQELPGPDPDADSDSDSDSDNDSNGSYSSDYDDSDSSVNTV